MQHHGGTSVFPGGFSSFLSFEGVTRAVSFEGF